MKSTKEAIIDWLILFDWFVRMTVGVPFALAGVVLSLLASFSWSVSYWAMPELKEHINDQD